MTNINLFCFPFSSSIFSFHFFLHFLQFIFELFCLELFCCFCLVWTTMSSYCKIYKSLLNELLLYLDILWTMSIKQHKKRFLNLVWFAFVFCRCMNFTFSDTLDECRALRQGLHWLNKFHFVALLLLLNLLFFSFFNLLFLLLIEQCHSSTKVATIVYSIVYSFVIKHMALWICRLHRIRF